MSCDSIDLNPVATGMAPPEMSRRASDSRWGGYVEARGRVVPLKVAERGNAAASNGMANDPVGPVLSPFSLRDRGR